MAIPSRPLAIKSSTIRRCSAAVPSEGILNSTFTSGSSAAACSVPRLAMVQKSAELFVTNAMWLFFCPEREHPDDINAIVTIAEQTKAAQPIRRSIPIYSVLPEIWQADEKGYQTGAIQSRGNFNHSS